VDKGVRGTEWKREAMKKQTTEDVPRWAMGLPDETWVKRLNDNVRGKKAQSTLRALREAGCDLSDICFFLYQYCVWERMATRRIGSWRDHLVTEYGKAEKALRRAAASLEEVNASTYLVAQPWGEILRNTEGDLRDERAAPTVVVTEEDGRIGITPASLTLNLPEHLRVLADHLRKFRLAGATLMSPRRFGRSYSLFELHSYIRHVTGKEPSPSDIALLLKAAVDYDVEPGLVSKDVKNFRNVNSSLCDLAEQKTSQYAEYRRRALEEGKPLQTYVDWLSKPRL